MRSKYPLNQFQRGRILPSRGSDDFVAKVLELTSKAITQPSADAGSVKTEIVGRDALIGADGCVGRPDGTMRQWSFWSPFQTNVLNQQRWATRQELRLAIVVWTERKYHRQRAQDALGTSTPTEFEAKLAKSLSFAA